MKQFEVAYDKVLIWGTASAGAGAQDLLSKLPTTIANCKGTTTLAIRWVSR